MIITYYYHLVILRSHGKSPFLIGKPSINGPVSMATVNNQRVMLVKRCQKPTICYSYVDALYHSFIVCKSKDDGSYCFTSINHDGYHLVDPSH